MTARRVAGPVVALVLVLGMAGISYAKLAGPHNAASGIGCYNYCHILPDVKSPYWNWVPTDIDDTPTNHLCDSCHWKPSGPYSMTNAPAVQTHSSLTTDNGYGNWTIGCTSCHSPHYQEQLEWINTGDTAIYLATGQLTNYSYNAGTGESLLTYSSISYKTDWNTALFLAKTISFRRVLLIPDTSTLPPDTSDNLNFQVIAIDSGAKTITVKGNVTETPAISGLPANFGIIYGQLLRQYVKTPAGWNKAVTFYDKTAAGDGGLTDQDDLLFPKGLCQVCHTQTSHWRSDGSRQNHYTSQSCGDCHKHTNGFGHGGGSGGCGTAIECHGTHETHLAHTGSMVGIGCGDCHNTNSYPLFADGQDLTNTTVCNNCHSADGAADAKAYFGTYGNWKIAKGEAGFCGSCHDATPGNSKKDGSGDNAKNIMGDKTTYGYFVTGHGKFSGSYARLAWQDNSASGNPAANQGCGACHDLTSQHFSNAVKRLKAGYENNQANSNCNNCHPPGASATGNPQFYTTSADYENSAHNGKLCTDCHDVHGATGNNSGMTRADKQNLCYQCHTSGVVTNNAISGASLATNIQQAFGMANKHDLGTSFVISGKTYSLQCTSCHNVHVITGKYWEADSGKSPVTRFTNNTAIWGAASGQKMKDYAGTGKYVKPLVTANTYNSDNLPDYSTFCMDCHANAVGSISAKDWANDPHGKKVAGLSGMISGGGVGGALYGGPKDAPDWKGAGRAIDWGQDRCSSAGSNNDCWPVTPRGAGTNAWVKGAYNQEERNTGANYVLSCTDCHEAHGSDRYKILRTALNRDYDVADEPLNNDRRVWDDSPTDGSIGLCMQCHQPKNTREHSYNPGWHNYGTCATGPCHQPENTGHPPFGHDKCYGRCHSSTYVYDTDLLNDQNQWATFHENRQKGTTPQLASAHEPGLVFNYKFENNLKDSNTWNLHGISFNGAVSYVAGKTGNAVVLNDRPIEVGTEEHQWGSTTYDSGGSHGNTSKLTEMKYNTTVEAWVYPTSSPSDGYERKILAKHNYWEGGYALVLVPINGEYRANFLINVDYGGPTTGWDGSVCNGLRGAYSSLAIPANQWSHIAATFDTAGPDGTAGDLSVGRIRIYVNGHDVTTSDASSYCKQQPKAGETAITPYTEFTTRWPSFSGWLATALSVGGLNWTAPNDNFVGRLDEVKLWDITKPNSYFDAINAADSARIVSAVKGSSANQLIVTFSEGVYTNSNSTGALVPSDFVFTDTDNGRTITAVTHTAGSWTATLTLSSPLDYTNDLNVDTVAAVNNQIFDDHGLASGTSAVTITGSASDSVTASISSAVTSAANKITVTFNKGVYTNTAASGALIASDFTVSCSHGGKSITAVTHTAGSATAILTVSPNLTSSDIGSDTVAPVSNQIFDDLSRAAVTTAVTVTGSLCPAAPAVFPLNEASGSTTVQDDQGYMTGAVSGTTTPVMTGSAFSGNGTDNHIIFANNDTCLRASTALTIEARIKPAAGSLTGTANKVFRIIGKDDNSGNTITLYQFSIWRNNSAANIGVSGSPAGSYNANGEASIAFWYRSSWSDGNLNDVILTNYSGAATAGEKNCAIVSDHWYKVRLVYQSSKTTMPGDIFVDDQGTTGNDDVSQMWSGYINCTDANQSFHNAASTNKAIVGATISNSGTGGDFVIGTDPVTPTTNPGNHFNGMIDWVKVQPDIADYTGVDDPAL